jgi:hypothetical protein
MSEVHENRGKAAIDNVEIENTIPKQNPAGPGSDANSKALRRLQLSEAKQLQWQQDDR